jgi:hypothetical protein
MKPCPYICVFPTDGVGGDAYIAGQRGRAAESSRISGLSDDARCRERTHSHNRSDELAYLVSFEPTLYIGLELPGSVAKRNNIFAGVTYLQLIRVRDGVGSQRPWPDQGPSQCEADTATTVETKRG